jgi:NTE family protein
MSHAGSYAEWHDIAIEHDRLSGAADWREDDQCEWIHAGELRASIARLRRLRRRGESWRLLNEFQDALFRHQGECAQPELYQVARAGTKRVIGEYLAELESCFAYLLDLDEPGVDDSYRLTQVKRVGRVYGRPALMLSGGALLGLFHFGVVKALFEQDLLPRTVSGSSMGSIIAAWACVHTDEELQELFADPSRINREALGRLPITRMRDQSALLDQGKLRRFLPTVLGDRTFSGALRHSRRILNITVSPLRKQQIPRLLNYLSAPDALVNSAVLASCAIPVAFEPVQLMARRRVGSQRPAVRCLATDAQHQPLHHLADESPRPALAVDVSDAARASRRTASRRQQHVSAWIHAVARHPAQAFARPRPAAPAGQGARDL